MNTIHAMQPRPPVSDEELARSRFHADEAYDPAILGQVVNTAGVRVLVYDEFAVYDIHAHLLHAGKGLSEDEISALVEESEDIISYNDQPEINWPHRWVLVAECAEDDLPKTPEEAEDQEGLCWLRLDDICYVRDQESLDWEGYARTQLLDGDDEEEYDDEEEAHEDDEPA
ncbi:MAG: hypothetical protein EB084_09235 [Proteobacteria bacterium]|nr:hypothetical protein [Pseudomonadota bacterium]